MEISFKLEQPDNAYLDNVETEVGMTMDLSAVQFPKAKSSIRATLLEMVNEVKLLQL